MQPHLCKAACGSFSIFLWHAFIQFIAVGRILILKNSNEVHVTCNQNTVLRLIMSKTEQLRKSSLSPVEHPSHPLTSLPDFQWIFHLRTELSFMQIKIDHGTDMQDTRCWECRAHVVPKYAARRVEVAGHGVSQLLATEMLQMCVPSSESRCKHRRSVCAAVTTC